MGLIAAIANSSIALIGGAGGILLLGMISGAWWKLRVLKELRRIAEALEAKHGS